MTSKTLTFWLTGLSGADREENMRRTAGRAAARQTIGPAQFIEIYVNTPLAVCQQRDTKGLYAKARQDSSFALSGIKAPYEPPTDADLCIDTSQLSLQQAVACICSLKN